MDSVFLGSAERDITELELTHLKLGKGSRVFLGELLNWVEHFALEEGQRLIQEGGKDGVIHSFRPTVEKLSHMVSVAANLSREGKAHQTGFNSVRVSRALEDLSNQLHEAFRLANQIKRDIGPLVIKVVATPPNDQGVMQLSAVGQNFKSGATVFLERGGDTAPHRIEPKDGSLTVVNETLIWASFSLYDDDAEKWTLVVTNPDGQADGETFEVPDNDA